MLIHPAPISETSIVPSVRVFISCPPRSSPFVAPVVSVLGLIGARCEPQWPERHAGPDKGSIRQHVTSAEAGAICAGVAPGRDEVPELWAVRTGQQADGDFLLDERRQPGNQCWFAQQVAAAADTRRTGARSTARGTGPRHRSSRPSLVSR